MAKLIMDDVDKQIKEWLTPPVERPDIKTQLLGRIRGRGAQPALPRLPRFPRAPRV
ncbi:hypothetical protein LCGC14_0416810 [marine sediment metagenome]|uniref:Uncharacterized protein n=1 Tax=marine sediment metagenome TaxID=412755 RepID=A0A0F9TA75_9ZZZZ